MIDPSAPHAADRKNDVQCKRVEPGGRRITKKRGVTLVEDLRMLDPVTGSKSLKKDVSGQIVDKW